MGWHPEFAVTREDALKMLTIWPAQSAFQEKIRGTIEVGKQADLSIFDTNFMTVEPAQILKARTVMTIVGGKIVHEMGEIGTGNMEVFDDSARH